MLHCPPPVVFVPPIFPTAFGGKVADGIATIGKLEIQLSGGTVDTPTEGLAAWFSSSFGIFRKQTEKYGVGEFLEKFSRFLAETSLRNIMFLEIDYTMVYADKRNENPDDLELAVRSALEYILQHVTDSNKVVLSAVGKTNMGLRDDLQLSVEAQFYRRHGFGKPAVEITVVGIPSAFLKQEKETKQEYETRLEQLTQELEDRSRRQKVRRAREETMKHVVADYEQHLAELFEIDNATQKVAATVEA